MVCFTIVRYAISWHFFSPPQAPFNHIWAMVWSGARGNCHIISASTLHYCNTARWAWLEWGLSGWLTTLLHCFDTVGWVIRPVKTVGHITYIVLVQTLNHAQSILTSCECLFALICSFKCSAVNAQLCWPKLNDTTQTTLHFLLVTNEGIY